MPIEDIRAKQKADQTQAIKTRLEAGSIVRIGNLLPITGRYEVLDSDGGISNNGVKVYNTQEEYGDRVLAYPRSDDTIALDSEKGSIIRPPTAFPTCPGYLAGQVFNCEEPKKKKGQIWILYFFEGKLWVGGHQSTPEEVGSVYLGGPVALSEENGGPGLILASFGMAISSNLHVWGDASGWVATYQTFPTDFDFTNATTFHSVTSTTHKKYSTSFGYGEDGGIRASNQDNIESNTRSFPLGAGFVSYRSIRGISSINPPLIYDNNVSQTSSAVHQVSIGYMEDTAPTVNQFNLSITASSIVSSSIVTDQSFSYSGTIPIPHADRPQSNPVIYSGSYFCPEQSSSGLGPYFTGPRPQIVVYPALSAQIVHNYPILCDRSSTYYVQESVVINGTSSIQKVYELRSTVSPVVIATNAIEPRFFGIRWDTRESAYVGGVWPNTGTNRYKYVTYSDPAYYYPNYYLDATSSGNSVLPVGHFIGTSRNYLPGSEYYNYPYFATFSGGQVVTVSSSEINKAKTGGADLQRQSVSVDGTFSDLGTIFCYPIPATAIILHWSTTA